MALPLPDLALLLSIFLFLEICSSYLLSKHVGCFPVASRYIDTMRKENTILHSNHPALNGKIQQHLNGSQTLIIFKQKDIIIQQIRQMEITAVFHRKRFEDNATNYTLYEFRNIKDTEGNLYKHRWIKETPMLTLANLIPGKTYALTLSGEISKNAINMPYPLKITTEDATFTKQEYTIRKENRNGNIEIVPASY